MITSCTVALLFLVASCRALEAFDCHSSAVNVTSYSLVDVEKCVQPSMDVLNETEVVVQVIQKNKFVNVEVSQCYLFIEQYITHCGMHSHSSLAFQGREDIFYEFSKVECDSLIQMNRFVYPYRPDYINTYSPNEYHLGTINVVGTVKSDSSCTGGTYTYKGSNLEDVIVQHKFKLYYNSLTAKYDVNNEELLIKGITCPYNKLKCRDFHLGFLFWNRRPNINCDLNIFTSVYRGPARQVTLTDSKSKIVYNILTVKQNMFVFSLRLIGKLITCYESYVTTDHSDLFVFIEGDPHNFRSTRRNETATENVSLISYINTKFYYVQHHFAEQLQTMYASILFQQCELKHLTFMNLLSLAYTSPEQFAYSLMKKPGYSAIVSGEIAHVIHCPSVHVSFRPDLKCYQEIPVTYKNQSAFITPRNRIITYHATEIVCNPLYGTAYNLSNVWTSTMNNGHRINSPIKLNPNLNRTWDFEYEHNLASAGLYSNEELESLTRRMLFANERAAVTNTLANTLTDADTNRQGLNFHRLLDEESIKKSISSHFDRFMAKLTTFGLYCSTAIGVVTIVKWSINAIEILLNAFHLYKVFGWSMKLFAAFFHSVTTYFLLFFQEKRAYDQAPYNDATAPPAKNNETLPTYPSLPV